MRLRSLAYYWRTNLAIVLGVATAASVLSGSLLLGGSVRASLRELAVARLGRTDEVVRGASLFRESLAEPLGDASPLLVLEGVASPARSGGGASRVLVYGIDERFTRFHRRPELAPPRRGEAILSPALAAELPAAPGDAVIVRVEPRESIPGSSLFGRRDERGPSLRLAVREVRPASDLGEFALRPTQRAVRAVFVSLAELQRELKQPERVNTVLVSGPASRLRDALSLEDLGLRARVLSGPGVLSLESESALVDEATEAAGRRVAESLGVAAEGVLSYLAVSLRANGREVPYSLVAGREAQEGSADGIVLNEWAARGLLARPGDRVSLEYLLWDEGGRFLTREAAFRVAAVAPIESADRDLVPEYPGITDSRLLSGWDPPFPVDLKRIRPRDEAYWERHRTTPKALLGLGRAQELFGHRLGRLTSLRIQPGSGEALDALRERYVAALRAAVDPAARGIAVEPVRRQALEAARGATDFGEYFGYFGAFLVGAALLLAGLFFRLGVEQRLREIGLLRAVGFPARRVRKGLLGEALILSAAGAAIGTTGAAGFAGLMLLGLRTIWFDAVGTDALRLHVTWLPLLAGGAAAVAMGVLAAGLTLRGLEGLPARQMLTGERPPPLGTTGRAGRARRWAFAAAITAGALAALGAAGRLTETAAFFGAGLLMLTAGLLLSWSGLRGPRRTLAGLVALGLRGASHRPGRSLLVIALIAAAAFVIVSVSAFRRTGEEREGTGGYALAAESVLAVPEPLGPPAARFRVHGGDDASCLNLYRPQGPRVLAPETAFLEAGRFAFASSLARTPEERTNPWRLLLREGEEIAVIADANSLAYVLHRNVGETFVLDLGGTTARLRVVGALRDSVLQGELLMAEAPFLRLFPHDPGYRFFLVDASPGQAAEVARDLESRMGDLGFDATPAAERLAAFHRVENTYIATFQALGGLGLLLGTLGLGAVLARNLLERRRELGLLRAVGYRPGHLSGLVLAENALLLVVGLGTGAVAAAIAIAPALAARGGAVPVGPLWALLLAVLVTGVGVSALGLQVLRRERLLAALRSE